MLSTSSDAPKSLTTVGDVTTDIDVYSNSSSGNRTSTRMAQSETTADIKVTPIMTKTFGVDGRPDRVSTSGKIAVALKGGQINIYDSRGVYLLHFATVVVEGWDKTQIYPHDVAFGTAYNDDVWVVGGDNVSHYVALYDVEGTFNLKTVLPFPASQPLVDLL
ncbi:uncharacterized protein LOC118422813 [Branchiostoma floridae]|uniref:Uncharacterized protein LOC118422813 n=1 Tax=Branchiostoma floridae TaxID=7739 RepID=A0A9J7LQK8_BRAFL|nr:uncharacterized protein LOC118422813 [Branchiostoma floridae]